MNRSSHRLAAMAALAAVWSLAAATGATSAWAAAVPAGVHMVRMTNNEAQAITSVYASPPGKDDWGDDLLGKQAAAPGKAVTLRFTAATPDACVQDLQMLMNDGKVVEKAGVNICETADYQFKK